VKDLEPLRPRRLHVYQNHHLDSTRWDRFETRPGDILITTAYKSGTTWMQTIVAQLIFQGAEIPGAIMDISPWIDMRPRPFDEIVRTTSAQTHRRFLKTHLALDGIPYEEAMQYVYVGRDLRDVFMSLWNHYSGHTEEAYANLNQPDGLVGDPFPRCPGDLKAVWKTSVRRGWFEWESDGYPYWSSSHHAQTWWDFRHLPNLLFVHFADLLAQPAVEIRRVAAFLGLPVGEDSLQRIVEAELREHEEARGRRGGPGERLLGGGCEALSPQGDQRPLARGPGPGGPGRLPGDGPAHPVPRVRTLARGGPSGPRRRRASVGLARQREPSAALGSRRGRPGRALRPR
jgi:aryl sulfotransferase